MAFVKVAKESHCGWRFQRVDSRCCDLTRFFMKRKKSEPQIEKLDTYSSVLDTLGIHSLYTTPIKQEVKNNNTNTNLGKAKNF